MQIIIAGRALNNVKRITPRTALRGGLRSDFEVVTLSLIKRSEFDKFMILIDEIFTLT